MATKNDTNSMKRGRGGRGGGPKSRNFSHSDDIGQLPNFKNGNSGGSRRRHSMDGKKGKKLQDVPSNQGPPNQAKRNIRYSTTRFKNSFSESGRLESGDFEYLTDEFELEEPFSESEEESGDVEKTRQKRQSKPPLLLQMPRRRIRTLSGMIPPVGYSPVWGGATMCLKCLEFFDLPSETPVYITHLLEKHKIVVAEIESIVDLKRYIEYWRHRFGKEPIENIFPLVPIPKTAANFAIKNKDDSNGDAEKCYFMSDVVPDDRAIREQLALRRLDEVLQCQQREREDQTFRRQCLFCRYKCSGKTKLVHHLYTLHRLNLGSPDNLVFINEYIDVLEGKMKNNECIYCEQIFEDHATLADHMRRKAHREVNPRNNYYDKFYVINYLELGKRWLDVLAEDFEDSMPTFLDSDEEEEEETWHEWQEEKGDGSEIDAMCLFCEEAFTDAKSILDHMKGCHGYDIKKIIEHDGMHFYDVVKMINFIRKQSHDLKCFVCDKDDLRHRNLLKEHLNNEDHVASKLDRSKWDKEEYLLPTYANDNILLLIDDFVGDNQDDDVFEGDMQRGGIGGGDDVDNGDTKQNTVHVIPEDMPELEETVLNDPELRDQLKS